MAVVVLVLVEAYLVFLLLTWIIIIAAIIIAVSEDNGTQNRKFLSLSAKALADEGGDEDIESLIDDGKKRTSGDSQV